MNARNLFKTDFYFARSMVGLEFDCTAAIILLSREGFIFEGFV